MTSSLNSGKLDFAMQEIELNESTQKPSRSLFVVGDDAQSIYGFRGSKVELILNFHREYPDTKEIILNQNYRSTQPILDLAEKILTHNPNQKKKDLFTENGENIKISFYHATNQTDEAEYIIRQLKKEFITIEESTFDPSDHFDTELTKEAEDKEIKLERSDDPVSNMFDIYLDTSLGDFHSSFSDFSPSSFQLEKIDWSEIHQLNNVVILYRTHAQSRALEETFLKQGLPYRLVSGTKFLDRKEIKDVIALLKFIANNHDGISFSRFASAVLDGVGPKSIAKMLNYITGIDTELQPKLLTKLDWMQGHIAKAKNSENSLIDLTKSLLEKLGYWSYLHKEYPAKEEYLARQENIGELYSLMLKYDEDTEQSLESKLTNFLAEVSLMTNQDDEGNDNLPKINLMSLHQSKGLEYETVFLVGCEDNLLPHSNSFLEPGGIEEEVRLAYVGVTRAKRHLHLTAAQSRISFGQIMANPVSRIFRPFLKEYTQQIFE